MFRVVKALLCAIFVVSLLDPAFAKRTFGRGGSHSYPRSGGLSGSHSGHSYPKSPGSSGHGYPSSGGLSGSGGHSYPQSGGLSGSGTGSQHSYPANRPTNGHGYPPSGGLSGNGQHYGGQPAHTPVQSYSYHPPQQIAYRPAYGGPPQHYPVYQGAPPSYVYQYKDSGSKYGGLLAGLALLNLGTLAASAYTAHKVSNYKPQPGEVCKFGLKKDNGDYEETRIDCKLISSFIVDAESAPQHPANNSVVTTVTNTTVVEVAPVTASPDGAHNFTVLPDGTMVPSSEAAANGTETPAATAAPADGATRTVTTVTNTTVVSALDAKGPPVQVTPGMQCFVIRHSPASNMRKTVPCDLLQKYSEKSFKTNSARRLVPAMTVLTLLVSFAFN